MTNKTHQVIGLTVATSVWLATTDNPATIPVISAIVLGTVIGSAFPDLDQPGAKLWRELPMGRLFGYASSKLMGGHRNLSHSLLGVGLFALLIQAITPFFPETTLPHAIFSQSALVAFSAHVAADAVTVMGIPLLWPYGHYVGFPPHPFHGARIVTGKWFENLVILPATVLLLVSVIAWHADRLCGLVAGFCR